MSEIEALQKRISVLERTLTLLAVGFVALSVYTLASPKNVSASTAPRSLTVKRLAVVDQKGKERVVIAAPLPDPIVQGKREKRDGPISGILIYDPKGNERGGYVTSDTGELSAFITLDSESGQVFTAYANEDRGATVWAGNDRHDAIGFSTHTQPVFEIVRDKKVLYKNPPEAPDLH
jgi:hypothetical protein